MGHYLSEMQDETVKESRKDFLARLNSKDWTVFKEGSKVFRITDKKYTGQYYSGYGFSEETHEVNNNNFVSRKKREYSKMPFWKGLTARVQDEGNFQERTDRFVGNGKLRDLSNICFDTSGVGIVAKVKNYLTPKGRCYRQEVWLKTLDGEEIKGPFEANLLLDLSER